jgi:hypothetical protein
MNIFKQIKNSVYGPEYYKNIVANTKLRSSIKYFAKFSLLIATLFVVVAVVTWPLVSKLANKGLDSMVALYPSDLEINIMKGEASINQPEPYFIKSADGTENLAVINTKEDFSISKFRSYGVPFMLTKTELVGIKNEGTGQLQIMPLPKDDMKINQALVLDGQKWLIEKMPMIFIWVLLFGFIAIFLATFSGTLLLNFLYAFGIWIMFKVIKRDLSYKKSYQVGVHALTFVTLISLVTFFGVLKFLDGFFVKLLLTLIIVYINFVGFGKKADQVEVKENNETIKEVEAKEIN